VSRAAAVLLMLAGLPSEGTAGVAGGPVRVEAAQGRIGFYHALLHDLGIRVTPAAAPDADGRIATAFRASGALELVAPGRRFLDLSEGELRVDSAAVLHLGDTPVRLQDLRLRRGPEERSVTVLDSGGRALFHGDHMHVSVDPKAGRLRLFNIDLRLTADAARLLGAPRYAGMAVGVLELTADVEALRGPVELAGACTTPEWGVPNNDVALIGIDSIQQMAREGTFPTGRIAVAPSATLKNVGTTEVPWYSKFSGIFPPYNNDQHPQLVWNMYRLANGALEQIGVSPLKHAFLTLNTNCSCPAGNILWVGCEDTYGTGTNDSLSSLGPRSEVNAHTGIWKRCGSIFDVNCDGTPNSPPPRAGSMDRRMAVAESDLQQAGATYYVDAWYIVRDDTNIFNTMGWRAVTPTAGSTWTFALDPGFSTGSVLDKWINPASPGPNAQSIAIDTPSGTLRLAVRATEVGGGRWHYEYALMNFDFDPQVRHFSVPLPAGATATNLAFHDPDQDPSNDWVGTAANGSIAWSAPNSAAGQRFSTLINFRFDVNAVPSPPDGVSAGLVATDPEAKLTPSILGPWYTTPIRLMNEAPAAVPGAILPRMR
jgi:hypothetical protein